MTVLIMVLELVFCSKAQAGGGVPPGSLHRRQGQALGKSESKSLPMLLQQVSLRGS